MVKQLPKLKSWIEDYLRLIINNSWVVVVVSAVWFLLRTGTKPSRYVYPCQQTARRNIEIFGLPVLVMVFHRLSHSRRYRRKIAFSVIGVIFAVFALVKMYEQVILWQANNRVNAQVSKPVVVRVKDVAATSGASFGNGNWTSRANESAVANMMDRGLMALTSQNSVASAWNYIFTQHNSDGHAYRSSEKIAVKVNFNNTLSSNAVNTYNNPSVAVAKSLVRGLKLAGVAESNITFYDFSRSIPTGYSGAINSTYPGVKFADDGNSTCIEGQFPTEWICLSGTLADATYLINMPLFRVHSGAGFTFAFKNHLGSVNSPGEFHNFFASNASSNSLIVLNSNSHIKNKTALILGDAIYVQVENGPDAPPDYAYNSLFFSRDPVAGDSVMADYLQRETNYFSPFWEGQDVRTYLRLAETAGLGVQQTTCTQNSTNCSMAFTKISLINCEPNCQGGTTAAPTATLTPAVGKPGDANGDNKVDGVDYVIWLNHYGENSSGAINGDFNDNGRVDGVDYVIWLNNYGN